MRTRSMRFPDDLDARITAAAKHDGVSVNEWVRRACEWKLDADRIAALERRLAEVEERLALVERGDL